MVRKSYGVILAVLAAVLCASASHGQVCSTVCSAGKGVWSKQEPRPAGSPDKVYTAVLRNTALWTPGQELLIEFLDSRDDARLLRMVEENIREWEKVTNLRFVFLPRGKAPRDLGHKHAHVRITFRGQGYSSLVGNTSIAEETVDAPSMTLGGLTGRSDPAEVRRVVLHEFGHALGYEHEHQNPRGGIKWKMPEAMDYYRKATGWDEDTVRQNIFEPLQTPSIFATRFDAHSIMLYSIPRGLTTNGFSAGWNTRLSEMDKQAASAAYPSRFSGAVGVSARVAPGAKSNGVIITYVDANSPATRLRSARDRLTYTLEKGDRVLRVDNTPVQTFEDYKKALSEVSGRFRIDVESVNTGNLFEFYGQAARRSGNP